MHRPCNTKYYIILLSEKNCICRKYRTMRKHLARVVMRVTYISHARAWWWRRRSLWWSGLPRKRNPVGDGLEGFGGVGRWWWVSRGEHCIAIYSIAFGRWAKTAYPTPPRSKLRKVCENSSWRGYVLMSVYETDVTRQRHIWNIYYTFYCNYTVLIDECHNKIICMPIIIGIIILHIYTHILPVKRSEWLDYGRCCSPNVLVVRRRLFILYYILYYNIVYAHCECSSGDSIAAYSYVLEPARWIDMIYIPLRSQV